MGIPRTYHDGNPDLPCFSPGLNSCFTLALVAGQSVTDLRVTAVANLGRDEVRLPHFLFEGDTVRSKSEVLETRESGHVPGQR